MADTPDSTQVDLAPLTTEAVPAPGSKEGQADGSPPPEKDPTSGGDEGKTSEGEKALRQRLTAMGEELSQHRAILEAAMKTEEWKAVDARLTGATAVSRLDELEEQIIGSENKSVMKEYREALRAEILREVRREVGPMAREVGNSVQDKVIVKALAAEGLKPDEAFGTFREDFAAENPSYEKLRGVDAGAAARWLASSYAISVKREGRTPVGNRGDASLERGSGVSARAGVAASTVKIARNDPEQMQKFLKAFKEGLTPVDENGNVYRSSKK